MKKINKTNREYKKVVAGVLANGVKKKTRSGEVISTFGQQIRFDLRDGFPLISLKKVYIKGVVKELLWFISGNTNIKTLYENNVHIWDKDAYRYFLEKFPYEATHITEDNFYEMVGKQTIFPLYCYIYDNIKNKYEKKQTVYTAGDLGPVYGRQWRVWNNHIDQLYDVIQTLKTDPDNRRLIVSAWNVEYIPDMALPPCHVMYQFYTRKLSSEEREKYKCERALSLMWTQRSVDVFLGLPFNIASYGLLLSMVAQCVGMLPEMLIGSLGDTHIYANHLDAVNELLLRNCDTYTEPTLRLNPEIRRIDDFKYEDIEICDYNSYGVIKAPLSVGL